MLFALLLWSCDTPDCTLQTWYVDSDGDGFHANILPVEACTQPEDGYVRTGGDCDDGDVSAFPGGAEQCDGVDNNCDGQVDEGVTATYYQDADGDGFGDPDTALEACAAASGTTADATDPDDGNANTYPGAEEVCDGADNDGDGETDEDPIDAPIWYVDSDGDGFGSTTPTDTATCAPPAGAVGNNSDCDDSYGAAYPSAPEHCDGRANDCDTTWTDSDEDGTVSFVDGSGAWQSATAAGAVSLTEAGTLWLCSGEHLGTLALLADVDVRGRGTVTLDATQSASVIWVDAGVNATIEGVRLTGGSADSGGGILVSPGAIVAVTDSTIDGNIAADRGGGIGADGATVALLRVDITDNAAAFGGGLSLTEGSTLTAEGATVSNNTASQDGGGIYADGITKSTPVDAEVLDTVFEGNAAGKRGGAVYAAYTDAALESVTASRNEATAAGGGMFVSFASVVLTEPVLSENHSTGLGAALFLNDNAQVHCTSSAGSTTSSAHGVYRNTGAYAAYINDIADYNDANTLKSSGCDWGIEGDENEDGDVYLGRVYNYTLDETFTCTSASGCR